jgi:pimeloyl-ACP methyl ester carboxylesterase
MKEREKYRERWVGALENARVPLRFIDGLADPVSGAHLVERFREIMPHRDIIELPGVGHFPHFETPEEVLRRFFEFHAQI